MKRLALVLAVLGTGIAVSPFVASSLAAAADGAAAGNAKIGVIDIERTLYETPAGKRASAAFDKARLARQSDLDKQQKQLQKDAADLDKQASILKPDVLKAKKDELEKKFVDLQQYYVKQERELANERTTLIQDLLKQANPLIEQIAKEEGVTLIVDQSAVLWYDKKVDLTEKLNAKMK